MNDTLKPAPRRRKADTYTDELSLKLGDIQDAQHLMTKAIMGNGQEGLIARTARIEEKVTSAAEHAKEAKETAQSVGDKSANSITELTKLVTTLTVNVSRLADSVDIHHKSEHFSQLVRKRSFWVIVIGGWIALHLIATYVPNVWDSLVLFLGLPKLQLPVPIGSIIGGLHGM